MKHNTLVSPGPGLNHRLESEVNELYLFHGSSPAGVLGIGLLYASPEMGLGCLIGMYIIMQVYIHIVYIYTYYIYTCKDIIATIRTEVTVLNATNGIESDRAGLGESSPSFGAGEV